MSTPLPKFILDPQAYLEIRDAYRWYENVRQGLGEEFLAYLDGYFKTLQRGNILFPVKRYPAYRELPLKSFHSHLLDSSGVVQYWVNVVQEYS